MAPEEPLVLEAQAKALHSSSGAFVHLANGQARVLRMAPKEPLVLEAQAKMNPCTADKSSDL